MKLLSRNAEALFWLARYLERGASLARVIEMQSSFGGHDREAGWSWLLALHSDETRFKERFEISPANIVSFYTTDQANPASIRSCIHWARENARALRPFIPLEMWAQLNAFHQRVERLGSDDIGPSELPRTCAKVRAGCLAQIGIAEGTLYRDEGYQFFKLGQMIERADQTSRLLDVKFAQGSTAQLSPSASDDFVFWSTILRTAAAYQVFNRLEPEHANAERVAQFLIFNSSHPRTIAFCVREIGDALHVLRGPFGLHDASASLEAWETMTGGLVVASHDDGLLSRLHAFNDWVQSALGGLTTQISTAFFLPTDAAAGSAPGGPTGRLGKKRKDKTSAQQNAGQTQGQAQNQTKSQTQDQKQS